MKIYISGKISGLDLGIVDEKFNNAAIMIANKCHDAVNPMTISPYIEGKTWEEYMIDCIKALFQCDAIYLLPDWSESKGAQIELYIAQKTGKFVYSSPDDIKNNKQ